MRNGNKTSDQIVAAGPTVKFETEDAAKQVVANVQAQYDQAVVYAASQVTLSDQCQTDIDKWAGEIEQARTLIQDREVWSRQRAQEKQQFDDQAQHARNVAKGAADMLALAGAPVPPPPNGELSYDPEGTVARWSAAVDEDRAADPERAL